MSRKGRLSIHQIAVVLAHFERPEYLRESVESILAQTHLEWRLYIVDDCSPHEQWFSRIADLLGDARIVVLQTSRNVGHYRIKNYIADRLSAQWIAFQDADDISLPKRLETQLRLARESAADIVGCSYFRLDAEGKYAHIRRMPRVPWLVSRLGKSFVALQPTFLLSRASLFALRGFDGTARIAADSDFVLRALHLLRIRNVFEPLYAKREISDSLTGSPLTGFGSVARNDYRVRMRLSELRRRRAPFPARLDLLHAPENDIEFSVKEIAGTLE